MMTKMQYDDDKHDEWWWHLLVQVAAPYRKGVVSNMGRSQIYIQCSTLIRHCHHHLHHHHLLGDNLWVKALNEGWMCTRLCLTVLGSPPFGFLANLLVLLFVFILLLLIDIIVIVVISWSSQRVGKKYKSDGRKKQISLVEIVETLFCDYHSLGALFKAVWCHFLGRALQSKAKIQRKRIGLRVQNWKQ